jgi:hypothetical protein
MVGLPTLCSWLSYRMGLDQVSVAPRIKFFHERSENLKNNGSAFWATIQTAWSVIVENAQPMPSEVIG